MLRGPGWRERWWRWVADRAYRRWARASERAGRLEQRRALAPGTRVRLGLGQCRCVTTPAEAAGVWFVERYDDIGEYKLVRDPAEPFASFTTGRAIYACHKAMEVLTP